METRKALLICSAIYSDPGLATLHTPAADVEEFSSVLANEEIGAFDVICLADPDVQDTRVAIARLLMDSKRDDVNLIYYSGYGLKDTRNRLFLGCKDTQLEILTATGLDSGFILDEIASCRAKSNVIILDCDYSGGILNGAASPGNALILASASAHDFSFDRPTDRRSPLSSFSAGLIEGLRSGDADLDGDGTVTFNELFLYARRKTEVSTEGRQRPRLYDLTANPVAAGKTASPIFLSYSRADAEFALAVSTELRNAGHKVWIDTTGINGGDDWQDRICAAIEASKLVLAILTPEAFASPWIRSELSYADKVTKPILPVFCKTCQPPPWYELIFGHIQHLDLTRHASTDYREPVLASVKRILQSRANLG